MTTTNTQHAFEDELFFTLRRQRNNWAKIAVGCIAISFLCLLTLILILPLKETKPYVVMVDKTTGEAEKIVQVRPTSMEQQDAVLQAELVSYVTDRETYDPADNRLRIPDVMARSTENAADTLASTWSHASPYYPPTVYGKDVRIRVVIKSIALNPSAKTPNSGLASVRLVKHREEKGKPIASRSLVATVGYRFTPHEEASLDMVWKNPLGFNATSYRIDMESLR